MESKLSESAASFSASSSNTAELARMRQLRKAVKAALDKTFSNCRPEMLSSLFTDELRARHGRAIEERTGSIMKSVRKNIEAEIDKICSERDLAQHLNRLDILCAEQVIKLKDTTMSADLAASSPLDVARDLSVEAKLKQRDQLRAELAALDDENRRLQAQLQPKRQQAKQIQAKMVESTDHVSRLFSATAMGNADHPMQTA